MLNACLSLLDVIICLTVVFPLSVLYWSGSWRVMDYYFFPDDGTMSACLSLLLGTITCLFGYFLLPVLGEAVQPTCNVKHIVASRLFIYLNSFGMVSFWRGAWIFLEQLCPKTITVSSVILLSALLGLVLLRTCGSLLFSPFTLVFDTRNNFYHSSPRFRTEITNLCAYSGDAMLTAVIVQGLCVAVWVNLWHLLDAWVQPADKRLSYVISAAVGGSGSLLLLSVQGLIQLLAQWMRSQHRWLERALEVFLKLTATVVVLFLWRGCWGYVKDFVFHSSTGVATSVWYAWMFHAFGIAGLMALQTGSTLASVGCSVDGEVGPAAAAIFPTAFITHWRAERLRRRLCVTINEQVDEEDLSADSDEERPLVTGVSGRPLYTS